MTKFMPEQSPVTTSQSWVPPGHQATKQMVFSSGAAAAPPTSKPPARNNNMQSQHKHASDPLMQGLGTANGH